MTCAAPARWPAESRATAPRAQIAPWRADARARWPAARRVVLARTDRRGARRGARARRARPPCRAARRGMRGRVRARCRGRRCPTRAAGRPLALLPLVNVHRRAAAPRAGGGARPVADPRRDRLARHGGGAVLDYERELRNVLAAVRTARADGANVRVVPFATPAAIRAALEAAPAHVLHICRATARRAASCSSATTAARASSTRTSSSTRRSLRAGCPPSSRSPRAHTNVAAATGEPVVRGAAAAARGGRRDRERDVGHRRLRDARLRAASTVGSPERRARRRRRGLRRAANRPGRARQLAPTSASAGSAASASGRSLSVLAPAGSVVASSTRA